MPSTPPQTDPEQPRPLDRQEPAAASSGDPNAPVTFVPHDQSGAVSNQPIKIRAGKYGEMEAHELLHLLDSIEDERARGRFRESIYISAIVYAALAWFLFYGPRVLWHAPKIRLASDVLRERELKTLNSPILLNQPAPRPVPPPRVDTKTLEHLRETAPRLPEPVKTTAPTPAPQPVQPTPAAPPTPAPAPAIPEAPKPQPSRIPAPVAEAPTPQPNARGTFNTPSTSDAMRELARRVPPGSGSAGVQTVAPVRGGGSVGGASEILSDTQGVDFTAWQRRFERGTMNAWLPLLPEEIQPPLMKKGETYLIITILPDGTIGDLKLEASSHDEAINRSCWGSIISQGKLPPLPKEFHGPNIVIRVHYLVNMDR